MALHSIFGDNMVDRVKNAKILVVGAGGIGCELLKNLVLSGFENIEIIDLDTIDVSNLNRQFLFRTHHVGKSKALIAKEVITKFNPKANIVAYHANIKENRFNIEYFKSFCLVMNALDNIDARKHVNRLCLAANIPLIESGTTGYLGQVQVIKKNETECYECAPKTSQKVYPICTIRSTPEKPVHCIVWAKECYKLIFGPMEESMLWEDTPDSVYMPLITRPTSEFTKDALQIYAKNIFNALFELEIQKKIGMGIYKGSRKTPVSISFDSLIDENIILNQQDLADRQVWGIKKCADIFCECIIKVYQSEELRNSIGSLTFDKDDSIAMEFITAASNLRSHIFHIERKSLHDCKGIAGNIIPAIATTNAIIAGIQVLEAFKVLAHGNNISTSCKYTYCNRSADRRGVLLNPVSLNKPNETCYVCSQTIIQLYIDTESTTLQDLIHKVLKKKFGFNEPCISIGSSTIYEEGEDAEESLAEKNLRKNLKELPNGGISHGKSFVVEDFSQDFTITIAVTHRQVDEFDEEKYPEKFSINGDITSAKKDREEKDDSLSCIPESLSNLSRHSVNNKRNLEIEEVDLEEENPSKRTRHPNDPEEIELE